MGIEVLDCPEDSSHKGKVCGACGVCSGCSVENSNYKVEHETKSGGSGGMKSITPEWLERVAAATTGKGDEELPAVGIGDKAARRDHEPWWVWHWDTFEVKDVEVPYARIKRWRRGCFFTIYRKESIGDVAWWIYLPFNIGFGFSHPTSGGIEGADEAR